MGVLMGLIGFIYPLWIQFGGYILIGIMFLAILFFSIALYYERQGDINVLRFTSYGLRALSIVAFLLLLFGDAYNLKFPLLLFLALSAIYYWFHSGSVRDQV